MICCSGDSELFFLNTKSPIARERAKFPGVNSSMMEIVKAQALRTVNTSVFNISTGISDSLHLNYYHTLRQRNRDNSQEDSLSFEGL